MGPIYLMAIFLLGLFHLSLAKVCPGCPVNNIGNNPAVYKYLSDKLKNYIPKGMENEQEAELVQIINIQEQVLSGIQHSYEFEARGLSTNRLYTCNLSVYRQAWKGEEETTDYGCQVIPSNKYKNKRSLLGGKVVLNVVNNDNLEKLKGYIGEEVGKIQGSKYVMKVAKYFKATKQIVDGTLITATVLVANTNCLQNEASTSENCQLQKENHQVCDVQVWLKPWMKVKEVTEVQCKPQPKFCAGCPVETNPDNAVIKQCLKRTLSNLNAQSHSSEKLSLVKINKATSQIVAGVKYTVDFDAKDEVSGKLFSCKTVIISQPWISEDPNVIDFKCAPSTTA